MHLYEKREHHTLLPLSVNEKEINVVVFDMLRYLLTVIAKVAITKQLMDDSSCNIVEGVFFNTPVIIRQKNTIRIVNDTDLTLDEFRPLSIRICRYLYDEGFVNVKKPKVEVHMKRLDEF